MNNKKTNTWLSMLEPGDIVGVLDLVPVTTPFNQDEVPRIFRAEIREMKLKKPGRRLAYVQETKKSYVFDEHGECLSVNGVAVYSYNKLRLVPWTDSDEKEQLRDNGERLSKHWPYIGALSQDELQSLQNILEKANGFGRGDVYNTGEKGFRKDDGTEVGFDDD